MTDTEYQEMLRAALEPFAFFASQWKRQPINGLDDIIYAIHLGTDYAGVIRRSDCEKAQAALATPPPSNKLRDMKDAPRDGEPFLAQWQSGEWEVPKYSPEYEEDPWRVFGSSYPDEAFRGWLPLPEVSE